MQYARTYVRDEDIVPGFMFETNYDTFNVKTRDGELCTFVRHCDNRVFDNWPVGHLLKKFEVENAWSLQSNNYSIF